MKWDERVSIIFFILREAKGLTGLGQAQAGNGICVKGKTGRWEDDVGWGPHARVSPQLFAVLWDSFLWTPGSLPSPSYGTKRNSSSTTLSLPASFRFPFAPYLFGFARCAARRPYVPRVSSAVAVRLVYLRTGPACGCAFFFIYHSTPVLIAINTRTLELEFVTHHYKHTYIKL